MFARDRRGESINIQNMNFLASAGHLHVKDQSPIRKRSSSGAHMRFMTKLRHRGSNLVPGKARNRELTRTNFFTHSLATISYAKSEHNLPLPLIDSCVLRGYRAGTLRDFCY